MVIKKPLVCHRDETSPVDWPFGFMQRIVTAGEGGVANVHVAKTKRLPPFFHTGYDEVYYILSGTGTIVLGQETHPVRPEASSSFRLASHIRWTPTASWSSSSSARRR